MCKSYTYSCEDKDGVYVDWTYKATGPVNVIIESFGHHGSVQETNTSLMTIGEVNPDLYNGIVSNDIRFDMTVRLR